MNDNKLKHEEDMNDNKLKHEEDMNDNKLKCTISFNENEEAMQITNTEGMIVFDGNYWDFPKGPTAIAQLINKLGVETTVNSNLPNVE